MGQIYVANPYIPYAYPKPPGHWVWVSDCEMNWLLADGKPSVFYWHPPRELRDYSKKIRESFL